MVALKREKSWSGERGKEVERWEVGVVQRVGW